MIPDVDPHEWIQQNRHWLQAWLDGARQMPLENCPQQFCNFADMESLEAHLLAQCVFGRPFTIVEGREVRRSFEGFVSLTGRLPTPEDVGVVFYHQRVTDPRKGGFFGFATAIRADLITPNEAISPDGWQRARKRRRTR